MCLRACVARSSAAGAAILRIVQHGVRVAHLLLVAAHQVALRPAEMLGAALRAREGRAVRLGLGRHPRRKERQLPVCFQVKMQPANYSRQLSSLQEKKAGIVKLCTLPAVT